ncbi:hypothetical protein PFISCL1PPCAC_25117, partial [Pristionchus fissidentatus]
IDPLLTSFISKGGVKIQLLRNLILNGSDKIWEVALNAALRNKHPNVSTLVISLLSNGTPFKKNRVIAGLFDWQRSLITLPTIIDCIMDVFDLETR